jgi:RNA polymerase sigma factor for flagellar operon FliA
MLDQLNPEAILVDNLGHIEKVAAVACRQHGLFGAEAEDFASWLKMRLIEDDYAAIRKFRAEAGIRTYLTTVVMRQFTAYWREQHGRWRTSAAAERLGPPADELEDLVYRQGYTVMQAGEKLRTEGRTTLTDRELADLLAQLPEREPLRPMPVPSDGVLDSAPAPSRADERVTAAESEALNHEVVKRVRLALKHLAPEAQAVVRMHLVEGYSVADVARALGLDQKRLYRLIPQYKERLRQALEAEGFSGPGVRAFLDQREDS